MTLVDSYLAAVRSMEGVSPRSLAAFAAFLESQAGSGADVSLDALREHLTAAPPDEKLRKALHLAIAGWDATANPEWASGAAAHTAERRRHVYDLLKVDEVTAATLDAVFPQAGEGSVVISDDFHPWYSDERRAQREFYWSAYKKYLLSRGWAGDAVARLDTATSRVVERLSDPTRPQAYQAKGLVVGYVQSGKTANFTGVVAKSVDAGYRLVIVLTGTIDLLRKQTQRRLDMELVGIENIFLGVDPEDPEQARDVDYFQDQDRIDGKFLTHGFQPSDHGFPDIVRLTRHGSDYRSLNAGITALDIQKRHRQKPLFDAENLYASDARLAVVKKNASVLRRLVRDLKAIKGHLGEIPTLIIDDESDQASVNTSNPKKWAAGQTDRTAINKLISELLTLLPRAQYVGYTATPYANVFIDPSDTEDIFPKDFLLSLERPSGYMGVADFHDLDFSFDETKTVQNSNEKALVRDLWGGAGSPAAEQELSTALDAFLLTGAIKLYRESIGTGSFRHHTMLVHESVRTADHRDLADLVEKSWRQGGYLTVGGSARLASMLNSDFRPVHQARQPELPFPADYAELKPFVGQALNKMEESGGHPVMVVNGDKDVESQNLDFEARPIWRVLVGGTKLSRGFTVEGLTISYYRRHTKQADTLMQMGRWFGFRQGYGDLVRLYIGRAEPEGVRKIDLYEAFEAIVRDEEAFRDQLRQYAELVEGRPQMTPRDIPPLVSQHLPTIAPSARNKMFNAELLVRRSPGRPIEPTAYPEESKSLIHNYDALLPVVKAADELKTLTFPARPGPRGMQRPGTFEAYVGIISATAFLSALQKHQWLTSDYFQPDLAYIEEITDAAVSDWLVIAPQVGDLTHELREIGSRKLVYRERRRGPLFGGISDPKHRLPAERVIGLSASWGDQYLDDASRSDRGVVLVYAVAEPNWGGHDDRILFAFTLFTPPSALPTNGQVVRFRARDSHAPRSAIVAKRQ